MKDMFKYNMDFYNKMIQNATDYYKYYTKMLEKFMDMYNLSDQNMKDKTGILPANGHDIYNYVARYSMSNLQIQAIMKLDGRLDFDKLKQRGKVVS